MLTFGSRTGDFTRVNLPGLGGGLAWQRTFTGTAMVLEVIVAVATPAINTWAAPPSGSWSDAARWSEGRVPIAGDTVLITAAGIYTVTLDVDASVDSLVLGGASGTQTIDVTGARFLTLTGDGVVNANGALNVASGDLWVVGAKVLAVNGGRIRVGGGRSLTIGTGDFSEITYLAGSIGGPGTLYLTPDALFNVAADLSIDSLTLIVDDAAVNRQGNRHLTVAPTATSASHPSR